jgi:hypothetical protein
LRRGLAATAFAALAATGGPPAEANVPGGDGFMFVSPGIMTARSISHGWLFDAELSAAYMFESWGLGTALAGNLHRASLELEPIFGVPVHTDAGIIVGLNPGVVLDHEDATRAGAQFTLWANYMSLAGHVPAAVPIFPFVRAQLYSGERIFSFGLMLKLPFPVYFAK